LQDRVYKNQIKDVEELCQRVEKWGSLDQRVIDGAVREWRSGKRVLACAAADGRRFKHVRVLIAKHD